jgi:hypothetical protein
VAIATYRLQQKNNRVMQPVSKAQLGRHVAAETDMRNNRRTVFSMWYAQEL